MKIIAGVNATISSGAFLYTPETLKLGELSDSFLSETNEKNEEKTVLTKAT